MTETDVSAPPSAEGQPLPAEAASTPAAPQPDETAAQDGEQKQEPAKKTFTQEEVDALVQKRLLREERRIHRRLEADLRQRAEQASQSVEPKRESFENDEAYLRAQLDRLASQRATELLQRKEQERIEQERTEKWIEKADAASERFPDFDEVVGNPSLPINPTMAEWLTEDEKGVEVAYHLGKHPNQAARIAAMTPVRAARELARIAAEISAPKPKASPPPDPITPVGSRGRASSSALPSDDDDIDTWMRKERERASRR